jgi:hypothetical protein
MDYFQDKANLHANLQEAIEQAAKHMVASLGGRKPEGFEVLLAHAHAHDMNAEFYRNRDYLLIKELDRRHTKGMTMNSAKYTKYTHLAESGIGAEIVDYLVENVPFQSSFHKRFGGFQRECSRALAELGDEHPWNEWLDNLPGGDLQFEALCRVAHTRLGG